MNRTATATIALLLLAASATPARGQQYNSDSWLSKPHGQMTVILTYGERNAMFMDTFSLLPKWEFTAAVYIFDPDKDPATDDGYSTSLYAKYMFYENRQQTGGAAVKFGTGLDPGYLDEVGLKDAFQTYWMNVPVTIPLWNNKVSWDIMPGASITVNHGRDDKPVGSFTYSTRAAWYAFGPTAAIVGEVYGAEGGATAIPEYRVGLRWEPSQYVVLALTYDDEFNGRNGAGFEIGAMLFTPPFLKL